MKRSHRDKTSEVLEDAYLTGKTVPGRETPEYFDFDNFEFKTIADFDTYNAAVRRHNRLCVHERNKMKIKVPDISFYKLHKVKFYKFQQQENVQKIRVRNKEIDWEGQLKNGGTYMLPMPVINFINKLATPEFAEVKIENGNAVHTETRQVGESPRFSCNILEFAS